MTGKRAVKEEVVEKAAVIEVKRMIEGKETEIAEIGEKDEIAEMTEEAGMKRMIEIAGENLGRAKTQKERQRVAVDQEIVAQEA